MFNTEGPWGALWYKGHWAHLNPKSISLSHSPNYEYDPDLGIQSYLILQSSLGGEGVEVGHPNQAKPSQAMSTYLP